MTRLPAIDPETATGQAKQLLDGVQKKLGFTPNILRTMANSPAVLQGYLNFSTALSKGSLSPKLREQIALVVAQNNECEYCLAAHAAIGRTVGLSEEAIRDSRRGESPDAKEAAVLDFASTLVVNRGWVTDAEIAKLRKAGVTEGEIAEIIANVSLTLFTNYLNHVAQTEIDFPAVEALAVA
ncbi:MAG: peroxidase-related enzyme [Nitrospirae bacterium]|nr:peroxidase-related enzyme [Nitrospirota bacterium]MDA1303137.1 peroxidase-related enzyme [Nitrospirota bacterium]